MRAFALNLPAAGFQHFFKRFSFGAFLKEDLQCFVERFQRGIKRIATGRKLQDRAVRDERIALFDKDH